MSHAGGVLCCLSSCKPSWRKCLWRKKATIHALPEDLLIDVLSLVPRRDLVLNCRLVCSLWRDLVDLPVLWRRKCHRYGYRPELQPSSVQDWQAAFFCYSKRNLVKNPCGEEGLDFWELNPTQWTTTEEVLRPSSIRFYEHFKNLPRPPQDIQKCFTILEYGYGIKRQRISLRDEGYPAQLMDETRPNIVVKDWYFVEFGSHKLDVKLLSADCDVLQECSLSSTPNCGGWHELSHTFDNYPPGVRYIDLKQEASCKFGVKITGTSVTIDPEVSQRRESPRPKRLRQLKKDERDLQPSGTGSSILCLPLGLR
ncbi:F-box only protein 44-like isoform X2 [Elgaria multicarinata webbii]|uniref:F-box only protein 44-like isoform X2 n=1 Tax=Elgaria multicarinata webbii TaxID=159646 RepID=UPI002FCCCCA8